MSKNYLVKPVRVADAAVDGLVAGLGAGILMAFFFLAVQWALYAESPGATLARFDPGAQPTAMTGLMVHLAVSAVYGLVFGFVYWLLDRWLPQSRGGWLTAGIGVLYGSAIFLVAVLTFSQRAGPAYFGFSPLVFWLAHVFYGGPLAMLVSRMWRKLPAADSALNLS